MNDHDHIPRKYRRMDKAIILTMISLVGTSIYGAIVVINKHAAWMKVVNDARTFDEEIKAQWHPMILKHENSIAVINSRLEALIEGQKRIENILLKRGSGWRSSTEGERNAG